MNLEDIEKDQHYLYIPPYGRAHHRVKCVWKGSEDIKLIVDDIDPSSTSNGFAMTFNRLEADRYLHQISAP